MQWSKSEASVRNGVRDRKMREGSQERAQERKVKAIIQLLLVYVSFYFKALFEVSGDFS